MSSAPTLTVSINPGSDGDSSHRPQNAAYRAKIPPNLYLEKIGTQWMQWRDEAKPGVRYYLDRLPDGYMLFEKPRPSNEKVVDKHLFGHPNHKHFDSPNRFFPHFLHLMNSNGSNIGCPCTVCGGTTLGPGLVSSGVPKAHSKAVTSIKRKWDSLD
ncbi:hypothetical protein LTS18_002638 [Coniosporium uncinatum]|uniref:Uncharacterized protein n=1 Tax=Coniosporium uncinatum TaxID=93489 RepID=A0ACC3DUF0_9PEZI|nr:hypothetical protein LTS18_002638 [Coniosporium uncinatum]